MSQPVKVKIDLSAGSVEIECDSSSIDSVFQHLSSFLPQLSNAIPGDGDVEPDAAADNASPDGGADEPATKRSSGKGTARAKETYRVLDLGLSEEERKKLREFYESKSPKAQHDQTAVLMDWFKREKKKTLMNREEIFTAFRTVDAKAPGKISSVLGNMAGTSMGYVVSRGNGNYELTHVAEDYVRIDLPAKKTTK